jgi:acetylornithine deacetylase/succinyl-diaminopimelate desuccinylase-like protein
VTLGYKGMIYVALRSTGATWGRGPRDTPIHGMAKSVVDSPAWRLVQALATLTGSDGNLVRLDGFDVGNPSISPEEREEMEAIRTRFGGQPWQRVLPGVQGAPVPPIDGLQETEIYLRYFFGASLNISGLCSGYTGPGTVTFSLPHKAEAFLDIRIPRTWKVQEVLTALRAHLDGAGFSDVEIQVFGAFDGSRVDRHADVVRAARGLFASAGAEIIWWPMTGGGGPWSIFANEFGIPVLRDVGLGHGRASLRDEYLVIEGSGRVGGVVEMALSHAEFMMRMAAAASGTD